MRKVFLLLLAFILSSALFFGLQKDDVHASTNCSVNIFPQPTPGTHRYTVTVTNNTSTPGYGIANNFWVDGNPGGNLSHVVTSAYDYWDMGAGGYSVTGDAGIPIANSALTYQVDLTLSNSFEGVDVGLHSKGSFTSDICSQGHQEYAVTYNDLGIGPIVNPTPPPVGGYNCSLNIYPQPTPGTHTYTVTVRNNTSTPAYYFRNHFWTDNAPQGVDQTSVTSPSDWYVHSPTTIRYAVVGTAGTPLVNSSLTYQVTLTYSSTFNGVDFGMKSYGYTTSNDICNQGYGTYTITYNNLSNIPPAVSTISVSANPVQVNTSTSASASFTDPDTTDTHTALWDWGDGNTTTGTVTETNGSGSVSDSHTYTTAGVYTVTLTVTDNNGANSSSTYQYVVVFDPNGGYVTGAGTINSPVGAYTADLSLTGLAHFGFNSKYAHGANIPTGDTKFRFQAAGLKFESTSYEWLVVAGAKAQYKGVGTVIG